MSSLFALEPQPTAKVLLQTTSGDVELELFAKQTPLAARNFLQLCLDGYYNGTVFHRLVPGFVLQGGDPTGTGEGGEAIYDGGLFADEFHSRLKFNRRGLLGMANGGARDDNGSQFFLTLDKTEELQGKNTMFGRVVGDTIYNVMKMAEAEVAEGTDRPLYPTRITGAEVLVNPYEDMVRRETKRAAVQPAQEKKGKGKKKKGGKVLLSFGGDGDDGDEGEAAPAAAVKKAKYNTKLVADGEGPAAAPSVSKPAKPTRRPRSASPSPAPTPPPARPAQDLPTRPTRRPSPSRSRSPSSSPTPPPAKSKLETTNAQIAALKASMRRHDARPAAAAPVKKSALEQLIPATSTRGRKRKHGVDTTNADKEALGILHAFKARLARADDEQEETAQPGQAADPATSAPDADEEEALCDLHFIAHCESCRAWDAPGAEAGAADEAEAEDGGWMGHRLTFAKDRKGKDQTYRLKKGDDELVVIDPRVQEAEVLGKARRGRKGAGGERERERERKVANLGGGGAGSDWARARDGEAGGRSSGVVG